MSWRQTEIARRLQLRAPIVQGPFGSGLSAVELTVAVSNAGLLGSFGVHHLDAQGIREVVARIRARTDKPFALNLWIPLGESDEPVVSNEQFSRACELMRPYFEELRVAMPSRPARFGPSYEEQIDAVLEARPAAFSFVYGVPSSDVIERCRTRNIVTIGAATTPEEATLLERTGVDVIVATGFEAGGHRVSFLRAPEECLLGTMSLVPQVVDSVRVPVIAAGGIADGRGVAAALTLGAQGVQIGTAFLACEESSATRIHREQLFATQPGETALTRAFTGRLARGIRNRFMLEMQSHEREILPYPVQAWLTAQLKKAAVEHGRLDLIALWSGQSAPMLKHRSADELIGSLLEGTDQEFTSRRR